MFDNQNTSTDESVRALEVTGEVWPMARCDASGTNHNPEATPPEGPHTVNEIYSSDILDAAVVLNGSSIYTYRQREVASFGFGREADWEFDASPKPFSASAAVADGLVLVCDERHGVFGLDDSDGTMVWNNDSDKLSGVDTDPIVVDDMVVIGVSTSVVAVELATGEVVWQHEAEERETQINGVAHLGSMFYVSAGSTSGGRVYAVDADGEEELWSVDIGETYVPPVAVNGMAVVGNSNGEILAINDGEVEWSFQTTGPVLRSPAVADGRVFIGSDRSDDLYCLDVATGDLEWTFPKGGYVKPSPIVLGDVVVAGVDGRDIVALSLDGQELWREGLPRIPSWFSAANGWIMVVTSDPNGQALFSIEGDA
jgi:outer membrane protein assembly factor BamB